jgi:hypothetical protein
MDPRKRRRDNLALQRVIGLFLDYGKIDTDFPSHKLRDRLLDRELAKQKDNQASQVWNPYVKLRW